MSEDAPAAESANTAIRKDCPAVFDLLSRTGQRLYCPPRSILGQGAQARVKAKVANATIDITAAKDDPMHLDCVHKYFHGLSANDVYEYTPSHGKLEVRQAWLRRQREETPSLGAHPVSTPIVTLALNQGLALVAELFLDPGDRVLCSDLAWEDDRLSWETRLGAEVSTYPFFTEDLGGFNLEAFSLALERHQGAKVLVALNFPYNPPGYTPTHAEAKGIVERLTRAAAAGTRLVVVCDDAYAAVFFDPHCETESLFGRLSQAHPNLLAVKVDGATREEFVWGRRVGFITFGIRNGTPDVYKALEDKTAGLLRATVANVTPTGQNLLLKTLQNPAFRRQQADKVAVLRRRAEVTEVECRRPEYAPFWDVYPFNSGYFMCLRLKGAQAERVRTALLDSHGIGTVALGRTGLRVAFSCLAKEQIPAVFKAIADAVAGEQG